MSHRLRSGLVLGLAVAGLSLTLAARERPTSSIAAAQLGVADVLFSQAEYRAAMRVYLQASLVEDAELRERAREGAIRGALRIGEFGVAATHAAALRSARPADPTALTLSGDALWASGLFDEAEAAYRDVQEIEPGHGPSLAGLAKALASRSLLDEAQRAAEASIETAASTEGWHALGQILERRRDYRGAAEAYTRFVESLSPRERAGRAHWTMGQVHFLRSFGNRTPYQHVSEPGQVHAVPFRLVDDKVIVQAKANGSRLDFAVDTGSEQAVLSVRVARRLGVKPVSYTISAGVGQFGLRGLQLGRLDSFEVGTLKLRNVPVLIKSPVLPDTPTDDVESFSPLAVGLSAVIDYGTRKLVMSESLPEEVPDFELPLRMHRLATVRGEVNGRPRSFIVDTGGEVISLNTTTARGMFRPIERHRIRLRVHGASGWDPDAYLLPGVNLDFSEIVYRNTPVVVLNLKMPSALLGYDIGGIVGHKFLGKYRVALDLPRSTVRLHKVLRP
ncbi:MAG TPA: aspartyl protease family protein [Vicinamibacterales bacterium]|nr:aspartyl protease family protein [Acidobacteriota bacterium]HOC18060.1 aspartyl protease family protein [Vicinamibacterales bacterium]